MAHYSDKILIDLLNATNNDITDRITTASGHLTDKINVTNSDITDRITTTSGDLIDKITEATNILPVCNQLECRVSKAVDLSELTLPYKITTLPAEHRITGFEVDIDTTFSGSGFPAGSVGYGSYGDGTISPVYTYVDTNYVLPNGVTISGARASANCKAGTIVTFKLCKKISDTVFDVTNIHSTTAVGGSTPSNYAFTYTVPNQGEYYIGVNWNYDTTGWGSSGGGTKATSGKVVRYASNNVVGSGITFGSTTANAVLSVAYYYIGTAPTYSLGKSAQGSDFTSTMPTTKGSHIISGVWNPLVSDTSIYLSASGNAQDPIGGGTITVVYKNLNAIQFVGAVSTSGNTVTISGAMSTGNSNFNAGTGVSVTHNIGDLNHALVINPTQNPGAGFYYWVSLGVNIDTVYTVSGCTTAFKWTAMGIT